MRVMRVLMGVIATATWGPVMNIQIYTVRVPLRRCNSIAMRCGRKVHKDKEQASQTAGYISWKAFSQHKRRCAWADYYEERKSRGPWLAKM